jgi:hypothetical protein
MTILLKKIVSKKVKLSDIASPKPSITADIVISGAMKQAYKVQETLKKEVSKLQYSKNS